MKSRIINSKQNTTSNPQQKFFFTYNFPHYFFFMGNQPPPSQEPHRINHPNFTNALFTHNNSIMKIQVPMENYSLFLLWEQKLNKITKFDDEVLLLPKGYQCVKNAICGSSAVLHIEYDNYPYILEQQLKNRVKIQKHFGEVQIWYLLFTLCEAANCFHSINFKLGDIRPQNIFVNEEGQIKVSTAFSFPFEMTNYEKVIFHKEETYLSPEEVPETKEKKVQIFIDKYKAEAFSVGLTVLQTGLLQSVSELYDWKSYSFNYNLLAKKMNSWLNLSDVEVEEETGSVHQERYSLGLKLAVAGLCESDPEERLTCESIYEWLRPFKEKINNLQQFESGLPVLRNMKKYEHLWQKEEKNGIWNPRYIVQQQENWKGELKKESGYFGKEKEDRLGRVEKNVFSTINPVSRQIVTEKREKESKVEKINDDFLKRIDAVLAKSRQNNL